MKNIPLKVALYYLLFGIAWILLTDLIMLASVPVATAALSISLAKGMFFILLSALVIYLIVRREQRGLRLVRSETEGLLDRISDVYYRADIDGTLLFISPQAADLGFNPETLIGRPLLDLVLPEDRAKLAADVARTLKTGEEFPSVFRARNPAGRTFWLEDRTRIALDQRGQPVGLSGIIRDITALKEAEGRLAAKVAELEKLSKMMIGREDRIIELKKEIARLKEQPGRTTDHRP